MALTPRSVSIDSLLADPDNARIHSVTNMEAITSSLTKFGQVEPLITYGNMVIAGNGRLAAMKNLGWATVEVIQVPDSWTINEARAYALAANRTSELGEWDGPLLLDTLASLDTSLLMATGFTETDLVDLTSQFAEPDLEQLTDQFPGDGDGVSDLWPLLSVRVPPLVMAAWKAHVDTYGGEAPAALAGLLSLTWEEVTT